VDRYLPRRASLRFVPPGSSLPSSPEQTNGRSTLGHISGNELRSDEGHYYDDGNGINVKSGNSHGQGHDHDHDHNQCPCCSQLQGEVAYLRLELAELRKLVKVEERRRGV
jgi:hypothetical protein